MFLSLPQWYIKFPQTFKYVTAAFNFIISAPFLKCNISIVCYKIMEQKASERPVIRLFISVAITLNFIYFFSKIQYFWLYSKKSASDFHFHSDYMISYICLSHSHSIYAVLTDVWWLEMKHDNSSPLTNLSRKNTHSQLGLLRHLL
jgi:hypothetical protein